MVYRDEVPGAEVPRSVAAEETAAGWLVVSLPLPVLLRWVVAPILAAVALALATLVLWGGGRPSSRLGAGGSHRGIWRLAAPRGLGGEALGVLFTLELLS